jgi:glycosyltransferase involved in cell wall biosynthesis
VGDNSSMPEVGGQAVLLCDPTDPQSIADQMQLIYKDEALRNRLIAHAPEQTRKYTWEHAAATLWNAVEKCLQPSDT